MPARAARMLTLVETSVPDEPTAPEASSLREPDEAFTVPAPATMFPEEAVMIIVPSPSPALPVLRAVLFTPAERVKLPLDVVSETSPLERALTSELTVKAPSV